MQNIIQMFCWSSIVFEKPGFLSKNWKLWRALTTIEIHNFCSNFAHVSYLKCLQKAVRDFFILFRTWVICRNQKCPGFSIVDIVDIGKKETCAKFQQNILNSVIVGVSQSFYFFRQIAWFLGNNRALSKFNHWILHCLRWLVCLIWNWLLWKDCYVIS